MLSLREIAAAMGGEVSGKQVLAPGPGHSAGDRSLSIKINDAGDDIVVCSFASDDALACKDFVRSKLGLPEWQPRRRSLGNGYSAADEIGNILGPKSAPAEEEPQTDTSDSAEPRLIATYDYTDANGTLVYQVLRFQPKRFQQRRPDGHGGWIYAKVFEGVERVPYRLRELVAGLECDSTTEIFITEGERDCDNVCNLGMVATCAAGNVWTTTMAAVLVGRDIVICEDNDKAGREKAIKAAQALHGVAKSIRICRFTDFPEHGDVTDWIELDPVNNNADALIERARAEPLWRPPTEDTEAPKNDEPPPLQFVDISSWRVDQGVPEREWGVRDLFPRRNVCLLSGEGAAGKTLLALQLGVAHMLGRDWLGRLPEPGAFLYFGAEDETDEIHRRLTDILKHYGSDFSDLAGDFHFLSYAGKDAVLGCAERDGLVKATPLFTQILKASITIKPVLIVLDTSADIAAISENDRAQVRQFVGLLRGLAMSSNSYVLVNTHPSLTGINTGTGLSGSTGWHNSVRARAYLTHPKSEDGAELDPNLRVLEFKKSNYGPISTSIELEWKHGVWVPIGGIGNLDKLSKEKNAERLFLTFLDRFAQQGRNVSERPKARNYAPAEFAQEGEAKAGLFKKPDFEGAMRRLFSAGAIEVQSYGPPSRGWTRLVTRQGGAE
jgi:RecA-family ATPase